MRFLALILTLATTAAPAETLRIRAEQLIDPERATVAASALRMARKVGSLSPGAEVVQVNHLVHRDDASARCNR